MLWLRVTRRSFSRDLCGAAACRCTNIINHKSRKQQATLMLRGTSTLEFGVAGCDIQSSFTPDLLVPRAALQLCRFRQRSTAAAAATAQVHRHGADAGCAPRLLSVQQSGDGKVSTGTSGILRHRRRWWCRHRDEAVSGRLMSRPRPASLKRVQLELYTTHWIFGWRHQWRHIGTCRLCSCWHTERWFQTCSIVTLHRYDQQNTGVSSLSLSRRILLNLISVFLSYDATFADGRHLSCTFG